jgi:hypothetical protein
MTDEIRKGVKWQRVQANGLSQANQKLYRDYVAAFAQATAAAAKLKDAVTQEWNAQFPNGKDGRTCSFNAIGGVLTYTWVDTPVKQRKITELDTNRGDNVFARPQ